MKTKAPLYITIGDVEYVAIPRAEYEAADEAPAEPMTEAEADLVNAIAADLKAARKAAGLSQAELATRLKRSQTMVAQAENGKMRVSDAYLASVLKACGLPSTWPNEAAGLPPYLKITTAKKKATKLAAATLPAIVAAGDEIELSPRERAALERKEQNESALRFATTRAKARHRFGT